MTTPNSPQATDRAQLLSALAGLGQVDLAIIGGGATGLGVALDATLRGLSVVLLEACDFAKGTSSRATKLVHGGVRYLAQGDIGLVREALHERYTLLHNAPHLARPLPFVMPGYKCWETPFYGVGLKIYDALAGSAGLGATEFLSAASTQRCIPGVREQGLKGGVKYWDGQFDDARLAVTLARTAASSGALLVNYCPVTELQHEGGKVVGIRCHDAETGQSFQIRAGCVVNATGVWVDEIRAKDGQAIGRKVQPMVAPSQGVHLVVDRDFLPGDHAMLVPRTQDGRVLFAVPWLGKVVLGTTDTPRHDLSREPNPYPQEVAFILGEAAKYLRRAPTREDVRSIWVGLRPLVRPPEDEEGATKKISREHTVLVGASGLVTVTGGKWTTYRAMAEDVLAKCMQDELLPAIRASRTSDYPLVGAPRDGSGRKSLTGNPGLEAYGTEGSFLQMLPGADIELAPGLTEAMVRFAVRHEYARTVEDVLARRSRMLFLDARQAAALAPRVADIIRSELGRDPGLEAFLDLAAQYHTLPA
ncbi:glycerol-3-phosphate dehydrogenase/oxidase [Allopusillimonas soli]|uniref:Glycerol-3-phosphate dehydrogenase/oxidase n=1 Tax=Allopusillimonas soli TaxID=659016 RepID=A0A853F4Y0_9BURK|nr:glycerol-3-phosphate dehydrogenase/oxidase [Allopusillimonas soli]NYT35545.1 glycerol-3-phosphate dehydrogenase/oxidase [Allopusillimonas soli]TEA75948.1 glycerol-3-phosphate dehydrogenase/oxidase [Allopusillimonas soli]